MTTQLPLVSICSPCYNHEKYLADYFMGILTQTYSRIELIIIDDASQDKSVEVIKQWLPKLQERFERVIFIVNEKNLGVVRTCNKAISEAKGDLIKLFATDDIMLTDEIKIKVDAFLKDPHLDMVYGNGYIVENDYSYGQDYRRNSKFQNNHKVLKDTVLFERLLYANFIPGPTSMIRKTVFTRFGLFDENIGQEDYEYWVRISRFAKIAYISKPTICYRKSEKALTNFKGRDGKKRLVIIWEGNKRVLLKYIGYVEKNKRQKYIDNFFISALKDAIQYNQKELAFRVFLVIKRRGIKIQDDIKKKFITFMLNPFSKYRV